MYLSLSTLIWPQLGCFFKISFKDIYIYHSVNYMLYGEMILCSASKDHAYYNVRASSDTMSKLYYAVFTSTVQVHNAIVGVRAFAWE